MLIYKNFLSFFQLPAAAGYRLEVCEVGTSDHRTVALSIWPDQDRSKDGQAHQLELLLTLSRICNLHLILALLNRTY